MKEKIARLIYYTRGNPEAGEPTEIVYKVYIIEVNLLKLFIVRAWEWFLSMIGHPCCGCGIWGYILPSKVISILNKSIGYEYKKKILCEIDVAEEYAAKMI